MQFLFLVKDQGKSDFEYSNWNNKKRFFNQAKFKNVDIVITSWNNLVVKGKNVLVKRGISCRADGREEQIRKSITISPDYIHEHVILEIVPRLKIHKGNFQTFSFLLKNGIVENNEIGLKSLTRNYIDFLRANYWPKARVSYSPDIIKLGKWYLEKCFLNAESLGILVNRPKTFLKLKKDLPEFISKLLDQMKVIICKPHAGTRSEGIYLLTRDNFQRKLKKIANEKHDFLVIQEFINESFLYHGRKTDLRIYIGVFGWNPLKFRVYRNGLTRISNKIFDSKDVGNEENSISTFSFLKTGEMLHNVSIDEYFSVIPEGAEQIWQKINVEVAMVLKAIVGVGAYANQKKMKNVIYLLGFDVLMAKNSDGSVKPVVLEVNHFPTLYRDAKHDPKDKVNSRLDQTYAEFFEDVESDICFKKN